MVFNYKDDFGNIIRNDHDLGDSLRSGSSVDYEHDPENKLVTLQGLECKGWVLSSEKGHMIARLYLSSSVKAILDSKLISAGSATSKSHIDILTKPPAELTKTWQNVQKFELRGTFKAYSIDENPGMLEDYQEGCKGCYHPDAYSLFALEWVQGLVSIA